MRFKKLLESDNSSRIVYHCSDKILIGNKPWDNAQGIHVSEDISTCKHLAELRGWKNPYYYKFTLTGTLIPYVVNYDPDAWYADDIATVIYNDKSLYNSLDSENKEIINDYKYEDVYSKKLITKYSDFSLVVSVLEDCGYNCISYKNEVEGSDKGVYSTLLFNGSFLNDGELLSDEEMKRLGLNEAFETIGGKEFYDYGTAPISGSDIFDSSTAGVPYYNDFLRNPKYMEKEKNLKGEIVQMTPREYFEGCAKIFNSTFNRQVSGTKASQDVLQHLKDVINIQKKKFPLTYINYATNQQEGRHRMYVAGEMFGWNTKFPVLVITVADEERQKEIDRNKLESKIGNKLDRLVDYIEENYTYSNIEEVKDQIESLMDEMIYGYDYKITEDSNYIHIDVQGITRDVDKKSLTIIPEYDPNDDWDVDWDDLDDLDLDTISEGRQHKVENNIYKIAKDLTSYIRKNDLYETVYPTYNNGLECEIMDGDWKHDHMWFRHLVQEYMKSINADYTMNQREIGYSADDSYSALYTIFVRTPKENSLDEDVVEDKKVHNGKRTKDDPWGLL